MCVCVWNIWYRSCNGMFHLVVGGMCGIRGKYTFVTWGLFSPAQGKYTTFWVRHFSWECERRGKG